MTQRKKTWNAFSLYIRLKYADWRGKVRCYTCSKIMEWKGEGAQAGHFQSGRRNSILFEEEGVRVQCYTCNCCNYGEQYIFGKNLEKEIGLKAVERLKRNKKKTVKYTNKDLEAMEKIFKFKAEQLAKDKNLII